MLTITTDRSLFAGPVLAIYDNVSEDLRAPRASSSDKTAHQENKKRPISRKYYERGYQQYYY